MKLPDFSLHGKIALVTGATVTPLKFDIASGLQDGASNYLRY